ncbi:MAG: hypothetical protein AAB947_00370 [Patescibacteria group bacterium]
MSYVNVVVYSTRFIRPLLLSYLFFPTHALAVASTFQELAFDIVDIIDAATVALVVFALVVYFWGIAVNIPHFGGEKGGEKQKAFFFWGLLVLFVMVSIWGIIQLLQNSLFSDNSFNPSTGSPTVTQCDVFGSCNI